MGSLEEAALDRMRLCSAMGTPGWAGRPRDGVCRRGAFSYPGLRTGVRAATLAPEWGVRGRRWQLKVAGGREGRSHDKGQNRVRT